MRVELPKSIERAPISEVRIVNWMDSVENRVVDAAVRVGGAVRVLTLWEGGDYEAAGQWTDEMAVARVKEILAAGGIE